MVSITNALRLDLAKVGDLLLDAAVDEVTGRVDNVVNTITGVFEGDPFDIARNVAGLPDALGGAIEGLFEIDTDPGSWIEAGINALEDAFYKYVVNVAVVRSNDCVGMEFTT